MRVTEERKRETRRLILDGARNLFNGKGFGQTTTRDIAGAAGVASGTVFNYFPSKEALAMTLLVEALEEGSTGRSGSLEECGVLEEALFAHVAGDLRALEPHQLRSLVSRTLDEARGRRLILSPTAGPYEEEPDPRVFANYLAFLEAAWEYGPWER